NGFIGEFMVIAGAFVSETLGPHGPIAAACAATGILAAALYMLHAVLKLLWGPLKESNSALPDLSRREGLVFAPLVLLIFYIGLFPNHMLKPMAASVDRFAMEYMAKLRAGDQNPDDRGLLEDNLGVRMLGDARPAVEPDARPL